MIFSPGYRGYCNI